MAMAMRTRAPLGLARAPARKPARVVAQAAAAQHDVDAQQLRRVALAAAVVGATLAARGLNPEAAIAARSGGRASSTGGFAARRAAAPSSRSAAFAPRSTVHHVHTTTVVAPAFSPFGGFGWGSPFGFAVRPVVYLPFPFLGGMLQVMLMLLAAGALFGLVRGAMGGGRGAQKKSNDWDDL